MHMVNFLSILFSVWIATTCGATGPIGPTDASCNIAYQSFYPPWPRVKPPSAALPGYQSWKVPKDGHYT